MPTRGISKHVVVYSYDGDSTFLSFGVISDGVLRTSLNEIADYEEFEQYGYSMRDLIAVDVALRLDYRSRIKIRRMLRKKRRGPGYFGRISGAFKTFFQGLKYQIKHRKK